MCGVGHNEEKEEVKEEVKESASSFSSSFTSSFDVGAAAGAAAAAAGAEVASGAAGALRCSSSGWGRCLIIYVLNFQNLLLSFHIIQDRAEGGGVSASLRGKCVVSRVRKETGRR